MSVPDERRARRWLALLFALTCAGLGFGLWALYPHLVEEHRRLEPWQAVLIWTGDVVALFWFVRYFVMHYFQGRPLGGKAAGTGGKIAIISLLLALAVDLTATVLLQRHDRECFQAAEVVAGEVHAVELRSPRTPLGTVYRLRCHFRGKDGVGREAAFYVSGVRERPNLPADLVQNLVKGQVPFPLKVSYDPQHPARTWITDLGGGRHGFLIHSLSALAVLLQGFTLFLFHGVPGSLARMYGRDPWWIDLHRAYPIMVEALVLAMIGFVYLRAL
ncbi:MAG: DUF5353 domain-containing protein [Gemmataceae bacterium]|nr:DUF5353 domain-containing protein [Gemmataceae bacterium]